ncbi:MAG: 50S ribosomal protein L11 methyltransferase [Pseudomonadota bacterium]|nr:50S ribosomal protein L11 methyltransferase [Pseudomonadota bacterium]
MFHKITFCISEKELKKKKILDFFENIVFEKKKKYWQVQIISSNYSRDLEYLNLIFGIKKQQCVKISKKDWVFSTQQKERPIETNFFTISQYKSNNTKKKNFLQIPASTAFGTGKHFSTLLVIKNIEWLSKKKKFFCFLDIGTGTGILAFVLVKIYKKKIIATDIDVESERCVYLNKRVNAINNVFFVRCRDFHSSYLNRKKFDLIVSNILLSPLKKNVNKFCRHLKRGGFVLVSGILKSQINDMISHYGKFNLKLVRYNYISDWASIVFKKI